MKKSKLFIGILIFMILAAILAIALSKNPFSEQAKPLISENNTLVCIKSQCFDVRIAKTSEEQEKGLSNISYLPENEGMLFVFDKLGIYYFWMKDTLIPLDMIWIDENYKIVKIEKDAQPCKPDSCLTIDTEKEVLCVLEINGNLSDKYDFTEGDSVSISNTNL